MNIHDVDASDSTESTGLAYTDRLGDYPPLERVWEDVEMNINGHEVERRDDGRMYVDDERTFYGGDSDPAYYRLHGELIRKEAEHADLVGEFVRREAVEKAEQDEARELDRRADIARQAWLGHHREHVPEWELTSEDYRGTWRNIVRALDADANEQEA
jgi:hypothetical protein